MATFNDLCKFFVQQKQAIELKGGTVTVANANPSPNEILTGINSIKVKTVGEQISATDGFVIYAAERPNTTLKLYNSSDQLLDTKVTDTTKGGYVIFYASTADTYTIKAYDSEGAELWTNSKELDVVGVYNIKSGLALNNYTWAEINAASKNGYAKYMWDVWDYKDLDSFMGSTATNYRRAYIIGFNHDDKVEGGKAGITFMIKTTQSTYKHWNSSTANWTSWRGSLIRKNCLKSGDDFYTYASVSNSSTGTYYVKSETNPDEFIEKTLPDEYLSTYYYYTKETLTSDGAFIAGMPAEMLDYMVQVKKKTFGGMDKNVTFATDQTTIVTNDWMFIPSDAEIFGNANRYVTYSKYALEGEQYEAFKNYYENRFRFVDRWLRSPYSSYTSWCYWSYNGYVYIYSASTTYYLPLCFCI